MRGRRERPRADDELEFSGHQAVAKIRIGGRPCRGSQGERKSEDSELHGRDPGQGVVCRQDPDGIPGSYRDEDGSRSLSCTGDDWAQTFGNFSMDGFSAGDPGELEGNKPRDFQAQRPINGSPEYSEAQAGNDQDELRGQADDAPAGHHCDAENRRDGASGQHPLANGLGVEVDAQSIAYENAQGKQGQAQNHEAHPFSPGLIHRAIIVQANRCPAHGRGLLSRCARSHSGHPESPRRKGVRHPRAPGSPLARALGRSDGGSGN